MTKSFVVNDRILKLTLRVYPPGEGCHLTIIRVTTDIAAHLVASMYGGRISHDCDGWKVVTSTKVIS